MPKIIQRFAQHLPYIYQDMPKICQRYAQNMAKICQSYVQDMAKLYPTKCGDNTVENSFK